MADLKWFTPKDPEAILDYRFDWAPQSNNSGLTNWLQNGETIVTFEVTVQTGLTLESSSLENGGTIVVVWLSGGIDGTNYSVTCKITTATRTDSRTAVLPVRKR